MYYIAENVRKGGVKMRIDDIQSRQSNGIYDIKPESKISGKELAEKITEKLSSSQSRDRYIPGEEDESIGLYELSYDDEGNPEIKYDSPEKTEKKSGELSGEKSNGVPEKKAGESSGKKAGDSSEKKSEKSKSESCTANTDKVDREIERLRKKAEQLEQRLNATEGKERERLEKQLDNVRRELSQKDNDSYRRQHTVFS